RSNIRFVPIVRFVHTALFLQNVACALYRATTNHADTPLALRRLLREHPIDPPENPRKPRGNPRLQCVTQRIVELFRRALRLTWEIHISWKQHDPSSLILVSSEHEE
ncbi:unnamed protein product, partial [Ixodes persulcatus]